MEKGALLLYFTSRMGDLELHDDVPLWRYIPLEDFLWSVVTRKLHFPRISAFQDDFEGSLTKREAEEELELKKRDPASFERRRAERLRKRQSLSVSCWHTSEIESEFMWRLYGKDSGICIQSNLERIRRAIRAPRPLLISPVRYVDFEKENELEDDDSDRIFFRKHVSFSPEREVRIVHCATAAELESGKGVQLDVDLDELVENLYISPLLRENMRQIVEAIVRKFGFGFPIRHSRLRRTEGQWDELRSAD